MAHHFDIATHPVQETLKLVAHLLDSILAANDRLPNVTVTHFHSRAVPNIGVLAYLSRILRFAPFANEVLLSVLVYFDRIAKLAEEKQNTFVINSYNIHRLLIASVVVASKFTSDVFYPNTRYAKVGGLPLTELNSLELEFLFLCNFDLHVRLEDLQEYGDQLLSHGTQQLQPIPAGPPLPPLAAPHKLVIPELPNPPLPPSPHSFGSFSDNGLVLLSATDPPMTTTLSTTTTTTTTTTIAHFSPSTESTCSPKTPTLNLDTSDSGPPPAKRHHSNPSSASPILAFRPPAQTYPPTPRLDDPKSPRNLIVPLRGPPKANVTSSSMADPARLHPHPHHRATYHHHLRRGRAQGHPYYHEVWVPQSKVGPVVLANSSEIGGSLDSGGGEMEVTVDMAREP
ncbi:cyclin-domain-containing protein [Endogone sp. FLAS-F59071]|nr:cyclin-domain-containing protein [Endogone sp. FLAS-F59071]|eukprot:RUS20469.1 cyclin-domain-containing protein [Endogone sp. FLAS-F59071]